MKQKSWQLLSLVLLLAIISSCKKEPFAKGTSPDQALLGKHHQKNCPPPTVRVFATGLNNPRGLKFGPGGYLYVAEGGTGGSHSTPGMCMQVVPPVGPYKGSNTGGRISRINVAGVRSTVTDKLPSTMTSPLIGGLISGVADVAFNEDKLYALLAGAGCSHGVTSLPNGVVKMKSNGTFSLFANLSAYQQAHPVAHPNPPDFEPDGTWYSMISVGENLFAVEPNHGELVKINENGQVSRIADISASQGHTVPTALAYHGNFYVGNLNTFPIVAGSSKILKITPSGQVTVWATGFTTILGLVFDERGRLYVLENTEGAPSPTPGLGKIIRVDKNGNRKTIATNLNLPTGITMGKDGNLYVSNWGFGPTAIGGGQVLQVLLSECDEDDAED